MPSPIKESIPSLPPPVTMTLHAPPSPGTHRALRKLQSAHNLGAKAGNLGAGPSLISQQHRFQQQQQQQQQLQQPYRPLSPSRRNISVSSSSGNLQQPYRALSPSRRNISISSSNNHNNNAANRSPQRGRANSDAPPPALQQPTSAGSTAATAAGRRVGTVRRKSAPADELSLERLVPHGPPDGDLASAVDSMRLKVLNDGIKSDGDGMSPLRIYVWLIMLDCPVLGTDDYLELIHRGASPAYSKIRNDTFRTLTTDPLFRRRVSEASLIRLLNAVAWRLHDGRQEERQLVKRSTGRQSLPHLPESPTRPPPLGAALGITQASNSSPVRPATSSSPERRFGSPRPPFGQGGDDDYDSSTIRGLKSGNNNSPSGAIPVLSSQSPSSGVAGGSGSSPAAKKRARALTLTTEGSETSVAPESGTYVQGMNVLAAPFLYAARSEAEAFVAFHQLLTRELPGYIRGAMDGVHKGLGLVDKVLAIVDEKLSKYLMVKGLTAEIYAFPSVLTLCACTPPLPEVLQLWDFLFAYGPHLNILCIVAQLMLIRSDIMASPSPNKLLRSFPTLQAEKIKAMTLLIAKNIPDDVYAEIIAHAR